MFERWGPWCRGAFSDLRLAARALLFDRFFTAAAIATLALGIGVNTAIFTLVNAVWLRPLPVRDPGRLVVLSAKPSRANSGWPVTDRFRWEAWLALQARTRTLAGIAAESNPLLWNLVVSGPGGAPLSASAVSTNYFSVLGVPVRGRSFQDRDDVPGSPPVAVISHTLWSSQFASDPTLVGRTVRLGRQPTIVVGVAAPGFRGPRLGDATDLWMPLHAAAWFLPSVPPHVFLRSPALFLSLRLYARLRDGVPVAQARAEAAALTLTQGALTVLETLDTSAYPATAWGRERDDRGLAWLLGLTAIVVLLVGCVNLAALLLARAERRGAQIAVRVALGIPRGSLVRLLGSEALLLASVGGAIALVVSDLLLRTLRTFSLPTGIAISTLHLAPDWRVLAFTGLVSGLAMVPCGVAPAYGSLRQDAARTLVGRHVTAARARVRVRSWLLGAHVALALVLTIGAALFTVSVRRAFLKDLGFGNDTSAFVLVTPNLARYANATFTDVNVTRWMGDCRELTAQLRALPGVRVVTSGRSPLLASSETAGPSTPIIPVTADGEVRSMPLVRIEGGPGYFAALGAELVGGRDFSEADLVAPPPRPLVVSEALARQLWPRENPLGKVLSFGDPGARSLRTDAQLAGTRSAGSASAASADAMRVIGVTRLAAREGVRGEELPTAYVVENRDAAAAVMAGPRAFAVQTTSSATAMLPEITSIVRRVFPDAHLLRVSTPREQIAAEMMRERMGARLFSWFAVVAIGLSVVGVWGLVAYSVVARTHEMAVRLALGASAGQLVRSIAWRGLLPVVAGAAVGLATAAAGQRLVDAFLFDVRPLRGLLFAGSALLMFAVGAVAALLPARRLLRLDPAQTLRSE